MPSEQLRVTDETGVEFDLGQKISSGAQGSVFRVAGHKNLAIKLLDRPEDLERISHVRRLPLDGLDVAGPFTLIRNGGFGYVMRLADEMNPLRDPYLPREFGARENAAWYLATGGLQRRLSIAAQVARSIASLHALSLAYVDLNPGNVMVSEDLSRAETWLIDTDNLTSVTRPDWNIVGYRGYLAPERASGHRPPSTLADVYSLGVLIFRLLSLTHPLAGRATEEMDGDDARDKMDRGDVGYIADPGDPSNQISPSTLPGALLPRVLSGRLQKLCLRTFGPGRLAPTERPGAARWRDVLYTALDNVVNCTAGCGWTHYRLDATCPNCGRPTGPTPVLSVYGGDFEQPGSARDSLAVARHKTTALLPRHVWGRYDETLPVVTLSPDPRGFEVRVHGDATLTDTAGKPVTVLTHPDEGRVKRMRLECPGRTPRLLALRLVAPT
jgi:DNA-binding helix-hairpin-helix protein with protein kinase domain